MKYKIGEPIVFAGEPGVVLDYNIRHKTYTIVVGGKRYYNIQEESLEPPK